MTSPTGPKGLQEQGSQLVGNIKLSNTQKEWVTLWKKLGKNVLSLVICYKLNI